MRACCDIPVEIIVSVGYTMYKFTVINENITKTILCNTTVHVSDPNITSGMLPSTNVPLNQSISYFILTIFNPNYFNFTILIHFVGQ